MNSLSLYIYIYKYIPLALLYPSDFTFFLTILSPFILRLLLIPLYNECVCVPAFINYPSHIPHPSPWFGINIVACILALFSLTPLPVFSSPHATHYHCTLFAINLNPTTPTPTLTPACTIAIPHASHYSRQVCTLQVYNCYSPHAAFIIVPSILIVAASSQPTPYTHLHSTTTTRSPQPPTLLSKPDIEFFDEVDCGTGTSLAARPTQQEHTRSHSDVDPSSSSSLLVPLATSSQQSSTSGSLVNLPNIAGMANVITSLDSSLERLV